MKVLSNTVGRVSMNLKLLFIITNDEIKINRFINKFNLPFNTLIHGIGTATKNMLDFFGLVPSEKVILLSIIPDHMEKEILKEMKNKMKLQEIGNGVGFTVPLSSSSKYVNETFLTKKEGEKMQTNVDYHLILSIVQEGYADKVMNIAKKNGANGGTLIRGRGLGSKNSFKFFNMTIEPEKDVVLIVCNRESKNKIMEAILDKTGIKTEGKGICISLPIDSTVGIDE